MLQQLGKIALFAGLDLGNVSIQLLIPHRDLAMPLHLHEDREKTQACVPDNNLLFTAFDNFRINQRPRVSTWKLQEDHALQHADLRSRNPTPIARFRAPVRERICQITDQIPHFGRRRVRDGPTPLPQNRVAKLQDWLNRHVNSPWGITAPRPRRTSSTALTSSPPARTMLQTNSAPALADARR